MPDTSLLYRSIPSVDVLLKAVFEQCEKEAPAACALQNHSPLLPVCLLDGAPVPRALIKGGVVAFQDALRQGIASGEISAKGELAKDRLVPGLMEHLRAFTRPRLRRVLNGSGVVVHTNLGRSLLAEEAVQAVAEAARNYSNLEFTLETGKRGSRHSLVEGAICSLTGAEAAMVVNNNAAAVFLLLDTLCRGGEVVLSRGQLVEIGGSFRIPDVMAKSGAILREVGTTNRTHIADYRAAIGEQTVALMRVHTSNYRVVGFHAETPRTELVALGREKNLPVFEDMGSGFFCDFAQMGQHHLPCDEPTVQQLVAEGIDIVTFSGDKVLGGPQAGIVAGKREYVEQMKKNPLARALRTDKMTLAALSATLRLYAEPALALLRIPTLAMICATEGELRKKAAKLLRGLKTRLGQAAAASGKGAAAEAGAGRDKAGSRQANRSVKGAGLSLTVVPVESAVGGGSFPEHGLPGFMVRVQVEGMAAETLRQKLLRGSVPLVARVVDDALCLDVRTLREEEFPLVVKAFAEALAR